MKPILLLLFITLAAHADIIRLSNVVAEAGPGITRIELGEGENAQILFVKDNAIITEADIAQAMPSPSRADSVDISLSAEGTDKMIAATGVMRPGIDRIAILVDGKILSAPVVQSVPLGRNFVINGLDGKNETMKLAARLSGKSEDEITEELAAQKKRLRDLPPRPEPVFHTEEEYLRLKAEREKVGLHYMDRIYSERELGELLKPGMKEAEAISIFGKPNKVERKGDQRVRLQFETAPEKLPETPEYHMDSFVADFAAGKLTEWKARGWSESTRSPKPPQRDPGNLIIKIPPADMSSEDFDFISFYEKHEISLRPGKKEPTKGDLYDLIGILWMITQMSKETQSIDSQCDIMKILIPEIPELAEVSKESPERRIAFTAIKDAVEPYVFGEKELK